jgi:oligosaccharide repeat unit polymerase
VKQTNILVGLLLMAIAMLSYALSINSEFAFAFTCCLLFIVVVFFFTTENRFLKEGKNVSTLIVLLGTVLWYFYPALIFSLFLDKQEYQEILNETFEFSDLYKSLLLITIFTSSFIVFSGFDRKYQPLSEIKINERQRKVVLIAVIFAILGMLPSLTSGLLIDQIIDVLIQGRRSEKPWLHSENIGNTSSGFLYVLNAFSWAGLMILIVYLAYTKDTLYKKIIVFIITVSIFLFLSIDSGTRSLSMLVILPSIVIFLIKKIEIKGIFKSFVIFSLLVIVFLFILQVQVVMRGDLKWESMLVNILLLGGSIDYFIETLYSTLLVPARHDYFLEFDLIYFATFPIPRFIWYDKPVSDIVWFYTSQRWGFDLFTDTGNIFPGLVGQYYMSWGYAGPVIAGGLYAFIARILDRNIFVAKHSNDIFLYSLYLMYGAWLFLAFRNFSPGFLFPVLMAHFIIILSRFQFKRR